MCTFMQEKEFWHTSGQMDERGRREFQNIEIQA